MFLALLADGSGKFHNLGHFDTDLLLDDFNQGDVRRPHVADVSYQRPTQSPASGVELAHASGYQVDQNVGVANFLQRFFR